ncbi:Clp protease N-terminal domain-containing protein [Humibacter ginsengisoli]
MDDFPVPQQIRAVVVTAIEEAQRRGSAAVAPEHLLLALASEADSIAAGILADVGLDYEALDRALDTERARSLAVVGIHELDASLLNATPRSMTRPGWASTTRELFRRAQPPGRGRHRRAELDVLYGVITANVGTVARALEFAGVDRDGLIGRVERERLADLGNAPLTAHQGQSAQERQALRREAVKRAQQARRER